MMVRRGEGSGRFQELPEALAEVPEVLENLVSASFVGVSYCLLNP